MAKVMITEDEFSELLAAKAAVNADPLLVSMGTPVLLDGYGEVFSPIVVSMPMERVAELYGSDIAHELDCE